MHNFKIYIIYCGIALFTVGTHHGGGGGGAEEGGGGLPQVAVPHPHQVRLLRP